MAQLGRPVKQYSELRNVRIGHENRLNIALPVAWVAMAMQMPRASPGWSWPTTHPS